MKTFDVRSYSVSDFLEWHETKKLVLSPEFQRRDVWSTTAKAFLADTIMRGKPFPKIILMQEHIDGRAIRVVVDGQQRLRAILDFVSDGIKISRAHNRELAGKTFSQLSKDVQDEFLQYQIGCDVLFSAPLSELLDIFARINRSSVKLNAQEIRNAQYSGFFKTAAFKVGYENVDAWLSAKIMTKKNVARMEEAEFASDLLATFLNQVQSSKSVELSYKKFEEEEGDIPAALAHLNKSISYLYTIYPAEEIVGTAWERQHMYFSLVVAIGHILKPLKNLNNTYLTEDIFDDREKLASVLNGVSSDYLQFSPQPKRTSTPLHLSSFIKASTLATTDTSARVARSNHIISVIESHFANKFRDRPI